MFFTKIEIEEADADISSTIFYLYINSKIHPKLH